jgi:zinc transport system substrate-binding protein
MILIGRGKYRHLGRWPRGPQRAIALVAVLVLSLAACSRSSGGAASDGTISVVASFYPVHEAVQRIGGDRVRATNLTPAGAEPHDLELTPRQVDQILDADVLFYMGGGFQPAAEESAQDRTNGITVDLLASLAPHLRPGEEEEGHEEEGHEGESLPGGADPHVWLDPVLMAAIADQVGAAMARADPAGASDYQRNAAAYGTELEALHQEFESGLRECDRRVIVTAHAAFGYLAARYGLTQESIAGVSPEAEPDPKRLAELADLVMREGITTIFTEKLVSPRVAETLAREAGVRTAVLNPLEGLTPEELAQGENYASVMRQNLSTLRVALGCR